MKELGVLNYNEINKKFSNEDVYKCVRFSYVILIV